MVPRDLGNGDRTPEYTYPVISRHRRSGRELRRNPGSMMHDSTFRTL